MAQNYDIKNRLWWEMVEINLRIFSGRKKLLLLSWWWWWEWKWKSRYIFISKGEIYLPNVWLWWWWRWWWMMMTMMTRIKMENRKEQLEKNYLPSGWPDPGSPRCRNCAKRIVTIHTQKCYFLKEIITIRTERQYFFNFSSSKKLFRRKTFNILYGRPKIFSRAFTFVNWFCQICLKILTDIQ